MEFERYEDQAESLRRSGIAQARGLWDKAALLGCAVVPVGEVGAGEAPGGVRGRLAEAPVELLARAGGQSVRPPAHARAGGAACGGGVCAGAAGWVGGRPGERSCRRAVGGGRSTKWRWAR